MFPDTMARLLLLSSQVRDKDPRGMQSPDYLNFGVRYESEGRIVAIIR